MGSCLTPFGVKNKITNDTIPVPCGKCPECMARRISGWSFRLMQEDKVSTSSHFITLTYDTAHVPITRNGYMSIDKRHLQLFFKRLRKAQDSYYKDKGYYSQNDCTGSRIGYRLPDSGSSKRNDIDNEVRPIKYYACGEYGGKTKRPHYHIILFNCTLELIAPAWNMGAVHYGAVSGASVGYTLKYMSKPSKIPMHVNDDRIREFSLMSKGLGENYLSEKMILWHHKDLQNRMYCNIEGGKKIAMPRYYKNKIYHPTQRKAVGVVARLKMNNQLVKDLQEDPEFYRNQAENHKAAFRKMHHRASDNRNKI